MPEKYMKIALEEAQKAYDKGEIPIGAIIVKDGNIVSRAHNLKETSKQACAHAEILAIERACQQLHTWRLEDCEIYVTLEPCPMCAGAIINARIRKLYIGAMEPKSGAVGSVLNILEDYKFNHNVSIENNIMEEECSKILQKFFKKLRYEGDAI